MVVLPVRDALLARQFHRLLPCALAQGQRHARRDVRQVFAEDQGGVAFLNFGKRRGASRAFSQNFEPQADQAMLAFPHPCEEMAGANKLTQGEVCFEGGPRRPNADHSRSRSEEHSQAFQGFLRRYRDERAVAGEERPANPFRPVHELVSEAATVAEKISIHVAVVTIDDSPNRSVALAYGGVAPQPAVDADRRRHLQVPFPRVVTLERLVGKDPGGTNLDQVAGEFALKQAVFAAAEKHLVAQRERVQIVLARVFTVVAHAPVALDAAIHLVSDEGPEVLIAERALGKFIAAVSVARHHGHVLEMALAPFVADRAIVRVALHQPFDDAGAKFHGLRMVNRNADALGHRRHASHHQPAARVLFVPELLDGALAARPDRAQRRMPAEIRQVQAQPQASREQALVRVDLVGLVVHHNRRHYCLHGQRFSLRCSSKSSRKYLSALCKGSAAPGASAQ